MNSHNVKKLFYAMLRIRMVEEEIAKRYKEQEMRCPTHLYIGQEAIAAGVCLNLSPADKVVSYHRSHGHYLAKGGNLKKMIAELYGKVTGCSKGRGGSQHLIDLPANFCGAIPIVAETIPLAVGMAWATKMRGKKSISVAFFGDAAVEEGVFAESLNFACLKKLPVLFVCENNLYSILTPMSERQPKREIFSYAGAFGLPAFRGDGNDVLAVDRLARKAVRMIRSGGGPVFFEFMTYRQREHCGPNFEPDGWRPKEEVSYWLKRDPIRKIERNLLKEKIVDRDEIGKMTDEIKREIDEAFEYAKSSPFPSTKTGIEQVYAGGR